MRRHAEGMTLLTDLSLAMRTDPLALIRGATEFVTVINGLLRWMRTGGRCCT